MLRRDFVRPRRRSPSGSTHASGNPGGTLSLSAFVRGQAEGGASRIRDLALQTQQETAPVIGQVNADDAFAVITARIAYPHLDDDGMEPSCPTTRTSVGLRASSK